MLRSVAAIAVVGAGVGVHAGRSDAGTTANPIRKVVAMLQNVQKKVEAEGEKEKEMFSKFLCYCKTSGSTLQDSISGSTAKVPQVQSEIEEGEAKKKQLGEDLIKHQADRVAAKSAMAEAAAIREKEAGEYADMKAETSSQIAAITKAVAALEKGAGGAFLQTQSADQLRKIVQSSTSIADADRDDVMAFLQGTQDAEYAPASGQITGILKELNAEMTKTLGDATNDENAAIKSFGELNAAKTKEIQAATKAIEVKTVRVGELSVSIVQMTNDLSETEEALIEDKKFLADLEKNCATAQEDYDKVVKVRAEELVALADTIKLLNDDDALELFKKALPSSASSLIETNAYSSTVKSNALAVIRAAQSKMKGRPDLDLIGLALNGKKVSFAKVLKMIDEMVVLLKQEQVDDNSKKEYCNIQFDSLEDSMKGLERSNSDAETAIADAQEGMKTLSSEIETLAAGIKALDKSVAEATEQRKEENSDFTALMAQDTAATQLLGVAKNRLNKFYNPKMYKAPPTEAEAALAQQSDAPPAAPERPGAYKKKGEESSGVIAMLDSLIADLDKEMTVAETEEKDAQADYENMVSDVAQKRATDTKAISEKEGAKADTEEALGGHTDDLKSGKKELMATLEVIQSLHGECDWLLQYFDVRSEARTNEIDALTKAKAVLSGADFSLIETKSKNLRGAPTMEIVGKPAGYRSAWDDCGGVGASATMRMQTIAAKIKGWSKPRKFIRNAAQDAGAVHPSGTKPGPAAALTYPAAGVWTAAREGLEKASDTLAKYQ